MVEITDFPSLPKFDGSERGHVVAGGNSRQYDINQLKLFFAAPTADWRDGCRLATTGNIDLATALEAGDSIDGIVLAEGDRVLVKDQTAVSENGVYVAVAASAGAASRAADFDIQAEVLTGAVFYVSEGTANAGKAYSVTSPDPHVVDTGDITFADFSPALGGAVEVQESGVSKVIAASVLNMIGPTVTDAGGGQANIAVSGGGSGSGGALVEIASNDFSANPLAQWDVDISGHSQVEVTFEDIGHASGTSDTLVRLSTDGVTFDAGASDYRNRFVSHAVNISDLRDRFSPATTGNGHSGFFHIRNADSSDFKTQLNGAFGDSDANGLFVVRHERDANQIETHIRFAVVDASDLNAGKIRVMGVPNAAASSEIASNDFNSNPLTQWDVDVTGWDEVTIVMQDVSHTSGTSQTRLRVSTDGVMFDAGTSDYQFRLMNAVTNLHDVRNNIEIATTGNNKSGKITVGNLQSTTFHTQASGFYGSNLDNGMYTLLAERLVAQVDTYLRFEIGDGSQINDGQIRVLGER